MCTSKPPRVPDPPPPVQTVKQPETQAVQNRSKTARTSGAMGGGSLLTGANGVSSVSTGRTSLLGS